MGISVMDGMKTGTVTLGSASLYLGYSGIVSPNKRGLLREITDFTAKPKGTGDGSKLLESVCEQADNNNIILLLKADTPRLQAYYIKYGFITIQSKSDILMARQPTPVKP